MSSRGFCDIYGRLTYESCSAPDMEIAQEEIFAPVMTVMRYDALEEAVRLANGTRYGLGASVFGKDRADCRFVMDRLECGMVCSNGELPPFFACIRKFI